MSSPSGPTRRPAAVTELALTPAQQRMWFIDRLSPGWPSHDEMVFRLYGPVDHAALEEALTLVMGRHEAVWTRFAERDGEPVQIVERPGRVTVELIRLDAAATAEREERLRVLVGALRVAPFDLSRAPLIHATLIRLADDEYVLCMVLHHIIADGTSWALLIPELRDRYAAVRAGDRTPPPAPALDFGDYVLWQHARAGERETHVDYWRQRLAGAPVLALHTDFPRPAQRGGRGATVHHLIGADLAEGVDRLARTARCTPFMVLLAAYQVLLARHSGQDDICVGSPTAGRPLPELEAMVGLFINMLVLRGDLSGAPTFRELLRRTRGRVLEGLSRQEIPYESIIRALDLPRDPGNTPLFQTMFALHTQQGLDLDVLPGVRAEHFDGGGTYAAYDLAFDVWRVADGLSVMVRIDRDLFTAETAATLARQYETILRAVVAAPDLPLPAIPLDDAATTHAVIQGPFMLQEQHEGTLDHGGSVLGMIEARVAAQPDAVAVREAAGGMRYGDLAAAANRLARLLRRRGVGPGSVVAVGLPRSADLVVAMLAIWKAGAAYLPLDPANPPARLDRMRADAGAVHLVTHAELASAAAESPAAVDWPAPGPGALAYVIYTSGSTGEPKGVAIPHGAVAARVRWMARRYGLGPDDRVLQFANPGFDTHVEEIFPCLASGATLLPLPDDERLPDFLAGPHAADLTVLDLPTPYWHDLVTHADLIRWPGRLRLVILGADQAQPAAVAAWRTRFDDRVRLVNTYGPTEATVIATAAELGADDAVRRPPIGLPIDDTTAYVLDERMRPAPVGVAGQLCLGGAGLARGYLGRPAATAERFVPDPYGPPGGRLYRTGDRARWRTDGQLEFLGRLDQQVKVRGHRVEPAEIEHRLLAYPGVSQAVVRPAGTDASGTCLAAHVVAADPAVTADGLRRHLAQSLPPYLIPQAIAVLDRLPLTANGKLDVAALPAPDRPAAQATHVPPRTDAEELVAAVWREVLGVDRVGATDDFFGLGGHSLLATRVIARLSAATGAQVPIRALFTHSTVAGLATAVEELLIADLAELSDEDAQRLVAAGGAA